MACIELVIKIDEKDLEYIRKAVEVNGTAPPYFVIQNLWESALKGMPLPKGHGRLIDADAVLAEPFGNTYKDVDTAETIIESEAKE